MVGCFDLIFRPAKAKRYPNEKPLISSIIGIVRYWPSIAHEGSSQETSADLQGQECCLLTDVQPVGSVLSTTTSTVVLVQRPESSAAMPGGQHALTCRYYSN